MTAAPADAPHVLVIEDDGPILTLFERSLAHAGLRVTAVPAPDFEPADVAAMAPDALVLDLLFDPRRRGFVAADLGGPFLDRLKGDPATAAIPVVVCSADLPRLHRLEERMVGRGVVALAKPCRPADLVGAVQSCLAARSRATEPGCEPAAAAAGTTPGLDPEEGAPSVAPAMARHLPPATTADELSGAHGAG